MKHESKPTAGDDALRQAFKASFDGVEMDPAYRQQLLDLAQQQPSFPRVVPLRRRLRLAVLAAMLALVSLAGLILLPRQKRSPSPAASRPTAATSSESALPPASTEAHGLSPDATAPNASAFPGIPMYPPVDTDPVVTGPTETEGWIVPSTEPFPPDSTELYVSPALDWPAEYAVEEGRSLLRITHPVTGQRWERDITDEMSENIYQGDALIFGQAVLITLHVYETGEYDLWLLPWET